MSINTLTPIEKIDRHLRLLGYENSEIHTSIITWNNANGSDWTVKRLKLLKNQFLHILARKPFDKDYVAYKSNFPRGPFGRLFKLGLKKPKLCISVLNSYMVYTNPNDGDKRDVIKNIAKPISKDALQFCKNQWFDIRLDSRYQNKGNELFLSLEKELDSAFSISTALNTSKPFVKGDEDENEWIASLRFTSRRILPTEGISCRFTNKDSFTVEPYGGELAILPERGNKARVIALPHAELQIYLKPLHDVISSLLRIIPEDCTHHQDAGAVFARDALRNGKTVHSVDLSAATDRFPLHLQMALLRSLNGSSINWASFFERSAQLKWKTPYGDITYGAGQPMGLYGSFSIFSLTHHAILQSLCRKLSISHDYRILGDDIIITNDTLASEYKLYMSLIDVKVSLSKTISSSFLAEFAGFIITRKNVMKPAKPPKGPLQVSSMVNYISTVGKNPFKGKLKDLGDLMSYLPSPYGCGFNPRGLSKQTRLEFYLTGDLNEIRDLPSPSNISELLIAKSREIREWNPYLRRYVENTGAPLVEDPVLSYMRELAIRDRSDLNALTHNLADARYAREFLSSNEVRKDFYKSLTNRGSLGRKYRVQPDEYVSRQMSWYKKLFGFYPFLEPNQSRS